MSDFESDRMLGICINQGYVPPYCKMNGNIVFGIINEGKNPCVGCNLDCCNSQEKCELLTDKFKKLYCTDYQKEKKKKERIAIRELRNENNNGFMFVDIDYFRDNRLSTVMVMKPLDEKMFTKTFHDIYTLIHFIPSICKEYKINQVYIDKSGIGLKVADELFNMNNIDIDIIPMDSLPIYKLM